MSKISDFTPDKSNANKGTKRGKEALEASLRSYGAGRSILLDKNGRIIAGNKTAKMAEQVGIDDVIVVQTDGTQLVAVQRTDIDIDDEKGRMLAYADNRVAELDLSFNTDQMLADITAGIDLSSMWSEDELQALLGDLLPEQDDKDAEPQVNRADELNEIWRVQLGDLWQIGEHRLICGDCTDPVVVAKVMQGEKAEMVWTDPPYGVAVGDKNKFLNSIAPSNRVEKNLENDTLDEPRLVEMLCASFDNAIEHCTAGAAWYVAAPAGPLHVLFGQVLKDRKIWRQTIQWVKNNSTFSPMGVCYHWQAEPIFFGWLPNGAHRYYGGRTQTTVWEIDRPTTSPEHPTMKPIELVARAIKNSSRKDEIALDVFCGSGTTLVACQNLNRRGRGVEISPSYCAVVLQRMQDAFGLTGVKVE
jgi:DNA modification methylase